MSSWFWVSWDGECHNYTYNSEYHYAECYYAESVSANRVLKIEFLDPGIIPVNCMIMEAFC
jgi:hypothetical protein